MRIARFLYSNVESYGPLIGEDKIISLPALSSIMKQSLPSDLQDLISLGVEGISTVERLMKHSTEDDREEATLRREDVTLLAPVPSPPKIVCLGLNYRDHAEEQGASIPDEPSSS